MLIHWLQLAMTSGLGPILTHRLVAAAGSAEAACALTEQQLQQIEGIGSVNARALRQAIPKARAEAEAEVAKAQALGFSLVCPEDSTYPVLLRSITDPPAVLYVWGTLEARDLNAVAIVGSRKCSHYGREQADRFGALLAGAGITVLSGGARGIDSAAHHGALLHPHGRTIAVLGSGLDVPYPPENHEFFKTIAQRGAVLSEFPLGTPPAAENFPRRNRIVSGMSRGVLVIEAAKRSGALITARLGGEEQGRVVFAVPGRVDNPLSEGPHQLIRDGATLATGLEDILEGLGPLPREAVEATLFSESPPPAASAPQADPAVAAADPHRRDTPRPSLLSDRQQAILTQLTEGPLGVDQIIERCGLGAPAVLQELTFLSLKGEVKRVDGQTYARGRGARAS